MTIAADQSLNLKPGSIIQNKYEVIKCLGAGSMGMVYAVKHLELQGRVLAMKVLFSDVARDEVQAARFRNEIVASYDVNHPHVVRAYDYFKEGEMIAYTMEYVSGGDLADRLNDDDLIPIPKIVEMLSQMASGVQAIHNAGIIHRDLKPENILLAESGSIRITDFGIARNLKGPRLTDHGGIVGTFAYVAPEYLEHGKIDTRSDIYSLGVLAYEMITGSAPYQGKNVIEEMHLRLSTDPVNPRVLRSDCPQRLADIILKALCRDPEERFQTADELGAALATALVADSKDFNKSGKQYVSNMGSSSSHSSNIRPKVLENEAEALMSGLKESLENSGINSLNLSSDLDYYAEEEQPPMPAVSISQGRLSTENLGKLKNKIEHRTLSESEGILGTILTVLVGLFCLLAGGGVGLFFLSFISAEHYQSAKDALFGIFRVFVGV